MSNRRYQLTLADKALIGTTVPLIFVFVLLIVVCFTLHQYLQDVHESDHSKAVISQTTQLVEAFNDVGFSFIVYDAQTKPFFEEEYMENVAKLRKNLKALEKEVKDDPLHLIIVKRTQEEAEEALAVLANRKKAIEAGGRLDLNEALNLENEMNDLVRDLNSIIVDEKKEQEAQATTNSWEWLVGSIVVTILAVVVGVPVAVVMNRGTARRLNVLMDNSMRLGVGEPLKRLGGNDEIAQIDNVFHAAAYQLKEAARKERAVIDNAADVICSIRSDGNFTAVSPAAEKLWGYAPSELIDTNWLELIHSNDAKSVMSWFDDLRSSVPSDGEMETRVVRKNGFLMDMRWSAHWSPEEQLMFCVAHDITERQELERFKQQFTAMISHDLRTPLTAVKSTLELLGAGTWGELSEKAQDKLAKAEGNLKHTIELINNLIDLEKMQTGKIELKSAALPLVPLLKRCASVVAPLAEARSIELKVLSEDVTLHADEQRLSQVIINLLGNAIKFSPPESKVSITVDSNNDHVQISVNDQGPGIPYAQRKKIFERYHQLPTAGGEKIEGTGLGLAICKAIIEAHGGTIGVDQAESKGSSFWFKLPK